ncbi:MAG TPA: aminodeoxychorismate synthase component I [Burkholderiales bacterium]|nr:aminodeoxychorismate synthase component I [Burkholderiales bacterium]
MSASATHSPDPSLLSQCDAASAWALVDGAAPDSDAQGVWVCTGLLERIEAHVPDAVSDACARIEAAGRTHPVVALLDYELGYWLEPRAALRPPEVVRAPLTALVFEHATWLPHSAFDEELARAVAALPEEARHCGIADLTRSCDRESYRAAIERILQYIHEGDCYQINYTWPMHFRCYGSPLALYLALRKRQPVTHGALVQLPDRTVYSLSPELFLERHGTRLHSRPMKGTAPRGTTPEEDQRNADALQASEKDRAENVMIVDLIRNDLGRVASPGSVRVASLFDIERYPTVLQMVSSVVADAPDASLHEILHALFPCGSITGAPKIRAMQIAQELERGPRQLYTGSIGLIRPGGDFSFSVVIRTLEVAADGTGRLGIGSGIVADSDPDREYDECLAKARFATDLPADFELIETLRLEPQADDPYPLLPRHLERLSASARHFGFAYDEGRVRAALDATRRQAGEAPHRVRLTLAKSGEITVRSVPFAAAAGTPGVVYAEAAVHTANPFLHHKTTVRGQYDAALKAIEALPGCFDALFFNERGELTEGARSNVYLVRDGKWYTPPLSSGVLNGVMRRVLMETHTPRIEERVLRREDVEAAEEIHLSNALRGLFRVRLMSRG